MTFAAADGRSQVCRSCGAPVDHVVLDLGRQPLSNAYLRPDQVEDERLYPLCARLCTTCLLVQVEDVVAPQEIFEDYAYFSSYSDTWVEHARRFSEAMRDRFGLGPHSFVVEIASNDGYLLQHFVQAGVPVLGVEPARNVAAVAVEHGVPTWSRFFGRDTAAAVVAEHRRADLVVANNVVAHVPDLNDLVAGFADLVAPDGVVSIEVPHLLRLVVETQFDTIYHEHYSYFSLLAMEHVLERNGLVVFDVDELPTHGGSLRVLAAPRAAGRPVTGAVATVRAAERDASLDRPGGFEGFQERVRTCRDGLLAYLHDARDRGRRVVANGAAAKGNTLLNHAGVTTDLIDYVVDRNPHKQGLLLPGSHLPVHDPERLRRDRPDVVLILPWNLRREIVGQLADIRGWGGRFAVAVPTMDEF